MHFVPPVFTGPLSNFLDRPLSCVHFHAILCVHFHGFEPSTFSNVSFQTFESSFSSYVWPIFEAYDDITLIGKSWKTHPEIFLKFSFSGSSHRLFYWKTHPSDFFDWNHIWYVKFGLDEFFSKTACVTPRNSPIDDWMSFPVKRSCWRPAFTKNWMIFDRRVFQ